MHHKKLILQALKGAWRDFFSDQEVAGILKEISHGSTSQDKLRSFFLYRMSVTKDFERLLQDILESDVDGSTQKVVLRNLHDEIGMNNDGVIELELSHKQWRNDFIKQLGGVSENVGDQRCGEKANKKDGYYLCGELLFLEGLIPQEFVYLKKGRNRVFPEEFEENSKDSEQFAEKKKLARKYIDDHIVHDSQKHFPDLLEVLCQVDRKIIPEIIEGIENAKNHRITLYKNFIW